jgi:hypothetical protein
MTNADWWARVVQARMRHADLVPQRVWTLRKGEHEAAIRRCARNLRGERVGVTGGII